ncbi:glycerophosphodiester phosphodiesterase [Clostridium argentinense]|uniref:glycerophosphodiester phosphodiesterase n=1 Tax=Clostridium argentinense TaxID=29341 RepID=UPI0013D09E91|nr:glycerophosphodiester phosphodiesterase [Clostridium argentinense]NFP76155.1 glycerophosphodiester phosphodiesterase [Clostridium argentinense]
MIINFAHRGDSMYYPENTMVAFEKAIEMGCTGIETDVQMTKDGVLVLIHDEYLDRTTNGIGLVKNYTYNELRKLDAGSFKDRAFSKCKIPSIEELIECTKNKNIKINFEIKNSIIFYKNIEEKLLFHIMKENIEDKVILSSFNHASMNKCKKLNSNIRTGLLFEKKIKDVDEYLYPIKPNALHLPYKGLRKELIEKAHKNNLVINIYTVNDVNYMRKLIDMKVDGIITNCPDLLKEVLIEY